MKLMDESAAEKLANVANTRADALSEGMINIVTALGNITATATAISDETAARK